MPGYCLCGGMTPDRSTAVGFGGFLSSDGVFSMAIPDLSTAVGFLIFDLSTVVGFCGGAITDRSLPEGF